jgi:hypothetical protein
VTARKSAKGGRKAAAGKKAGGAGRPVRKAAAKRAAPPRPAAEKPAPAPKAAPEPKPAPAERRAGKGGAAAGDVNMGHVFALRPRVATSFRQEDFRTARHLLQDERYASVEEAARAVVEKALELTREAGSRAVRPVR